ncbi:hypothetical protein EDB89DRAFT_1234661 [Lactarius sanguifluus]|nr:hypothetical protein EDB89DRAFT_1234661 [Lactarius sanguifluus]
MDTFRVSFLHSIFSAVRIPRALAAKSSIFGLFSLGPVSCGLLPFRIRILTASRFAIDSLLSIPSLLARLVCTHAHSLSLPPCRSLLVLPSIAHGLRPSPLVFAHQDTPQPLVHRPRVPAPRVPFVHRHPVPIASPSVPIPLNLSKPFAFVYHLGHAVPLSMAEARFDFIVL